MVTAHAESQPTAPRVERPSPGRQPAEIAPPEVAQELVLPAAAAGLLAVGALALRRSSPPAALTAARFLNLLLASLLTGNGVGGERFVHPALRGLPPGAYLEAEQAITRRYPGTMLTLLPASVASGLLVLGLLPRPPGRSFWLTLGGTLGFVGVLATTLAELPLNRQTLRASPEAPQPWLQERPRWERFNRARTLLEAASWSLLCLGALSDRGGERPRGRA
jgi:uncharacterized membrane protein